MKLSKSTGICWSCALIAMAVVIEGTFCQQIHLTAPFNSASDSFHERLGVNFGFSLAGSQGPGSRIVGLGPAGQLSPNITFSQNGSGSAIPAFGGFDPNSGARFGFRRGFSGGGGFSLGFDLSQGSTRTLSSTAPSITIPNGGIGFFGSGAVSPFVTGVTPVVGDDYPPDNAVTRAISSGQLRPPQARPEDASERKSSVDYGNSASSAVRGDASVAEIKAQLADQKLAQQTNLKNALERAKTSAESGDYRSARINLRAAIRLTKDAVQERQLRDRLKQLSGKD